VNTSDEAALRTLATALDQLEVALCVFDEEDRTLLWNDTFLQFFPEHAGHVYPGEHYRENLRRFYRQRLSEEELPSMERYIDDGVLRHRSPAARRPRPRALVAQDTALAHGHAGPAQSPGGAFAGIHLS
jgi:PAS domain-containing protein